MDKQKSYTTIDEYIALFPPEVQAKLEEIRTAIREVVPSASEKISYQMPTFYLEGNLVHFGAFQHHIGFFPTPSGIDQFATELAPYKTSKGTIQFPMDQPVPLDLVRRITAFRAAENLAIAASKRKK